MLINTQALAPYNRDQIAAECARLSTTRFDAAELDRIYGAMIVHRAELYGADRLDAQETMILTNQLEQMRVRTADILRPAYKARQLIPVTSEIDPGAETWGYSQWDRAGMAKIVANYADDIPKVATFAKKFTQHVETIALGYEWSWLDMLRTAKAGVPLKARKASAVRDGFEARIEEIGAIGFPSTGAPGLLNNSNVPQITAAAPATGSLTGWAAGHKTAFEVLDDLLAMEDAIINTTKGVHKPDTLILPMARYRFLRKAALSTASGASPKDTILKVFLERSETIRNVDYWRFCDTAATGGLPRAVMYARDPAVVHFEIPLEQQELPVQAKNLAMEINSVGRIGGVAWEYPLAAIYMNGI